MMTLAGIFARNMHFATSPWYKLAFAKVKVSVRLHAVAVNQ